MSFCRHKKIFLSFFNNSTAKGKFKAACRHVSEALFNRNTILTPRGRKLHPPSLKLRWTDGQRFMFLNKKYHIIQAASGGKQGSVVFVNANNVAKTYFPKDVRALDIYGNDPEKILKEAIKSL